MSPFTWPSLWTSSLFLTTLSNDIGYKLTTVHIIMQNKDRTHFSCNTELFICTNNSKQCDYSNRSKIYELTCWCNCNTVLTFKLQYCTYFPSFMFLSAFPLCCHGHQHLYKSHRWGSEISLLTVCQHIKNMSYTLGFHLKVTKFSQHTYRKYKAGFHVT